MEDWVGIMKASIEQNLTIKKLAQKSGVRIETIRFYERKGLLEPAKRSEKGYRLFAEHIIKPLKKTNEDFMLKLEH